MRTISPVAVLILGLAALGMGTAVLSQPAKRTPAPAKPAPAFVPGFDDIMTMLVQPRHVRLYYAGRERNWELAAAEMRDLRASFDRLAQAIPNYQGNDVNASVKSLIAPQMAAVDNAIAAADPKKFENTYGELTKACNACHTYMEHPFIIIKNPDSPKDTAQPDQEFKAAP
jgi:hypothetical protein